MPQKKRKERLNEGETGIRIVDLNQSYSGPYREKNCS